MSKEGKSPSSDPLFAVLKACAVLHLHVRYVIKPADPKNTSQASHVKCLQAIYDSIEQGPGFHTVQQMAPDIVEPAKRRRCHICPRDLERKIRQRCEKCKRPVCGEHFDNVIKCNVYKELEGN